MTKNMEYIKNVSETFLRTKFADNLPTIEQIQNTANEVRQMCEKNYPISDEEFQAVSTYLQENTLHTIDRAVTLRGKDSEHKSWYFTSENDGYFWLRYRKYLFDVKHWNTETVKRLHETTDNIMDDLGDPSDKQRPFQRRGLLLGDVQSGKTATYTAICSKATDAGYKVIIVLAGMMENLRAQTQSRLDMEFVGVDSKYSLDKRGKNEIRSKTKIGVGKIPPFNDTKHISTFTSVGTDFSVQALKANGLSLNHLNDTALFVVKKNKKILDNLYDWLNGTPKDESGLIDLPLLLIDDEADNASINTNSEDSDPTAINSAIRKILGCFRQATYLGITATPFANIFIDPDSYDGENRDLFPKDFLTVLPTPDHYIGASKIFGKEDDDYESSGNNNQQRDGMYHSSIIPINNSEQNYYFVFKHKKDLASRLDNLPGSMYEAIRYFILVTAISDLRYDANEHRSMLVNVSRFTKVQNRVADLINEYIIDVKSDLENYSQLSASKAEKIENISQLHTTWNDYGLDQVSNVSWDVLLKDYLFKAVRRIEVRSVNQDSGASALNYEEYSGSGMRVIAVGGNSLSRGLTLEGLIVSYFYRNTMMYDTLLQMGRWFGYRPNYSDLFKIWMGEDVIDWYGYINDAVNELKDELKKMQRQNLTPNEFGLKVRQAPGALMVTAQNKMRSAIRVSQPITVSGRMIETPRLIGSAETLKSNEETCRDIIRKISTDLSVSEVEFDSFTNAYIWRNVPKKYIIKLVENFKTHPWNLNFQPVALAEYISAADELALWDVAIPNGSGKGSAQVFEIEDGNTISVIPEGRRIVADLTIKNMIRVNGHHVRVGTGGCARIGLSEAQIKEIRSESQKSSDDKPYLIEDRKPLALIHVLYNTDQDEQHTLENEIIYALGLGFPQGQEEKTANYVINVREINNWRLTADDEYTDED